MLVKSEFNCLHSSIPVLLCWVYQSCVHGGGDGDDGADTVVDTEWLCVHADWSSVCSHDAESEANHLCRGSYCSQKNKTILGLKCTNHLETMTQKVRQASWTEQELELLELDWTLNISSETYSVECRHVDSQAEDLESSWGGSCRLSRNIRNRNYDDSQKVIFTYKQTKHCLIIKLSLNVLIYLYYTIHYNWEIKHLWIFAWRCWDVSSLSDDDQTASAQLIRAGAFWWSAVCYNSHILHHPCSKCLTLTSHCLSNKLLTHTLTRFPA